MRGEFIDLSGQRIYYYAAGTRGAGDPIVLIHGFPESSHVWSEVVPKLPSGHRVIVMDLLGFGRSDAPLNSGYGIADHGRRVVAFLKALKIDRACVVGHGVGGAVAQWLAVNADPLVSRIGLVDVATDDRWFAPRPAIRRGVESAVLRLPIWLWHPLIRRSLALGYEDAEHGYRSAEIYLKPFTIGDGASVFRRHLAHLLPGDIVEIDRSSQSLRIPSAVFGSRFDRFSPEERPSDVAASIAQLLSD